MNVVSRTLAVKLKFPRRKICRMLKRVQQCRRNRMNLNMANLRATLPVANLQRRRASSPSVLLRSRSPSRMSLLNSTKGSIDPMKRERIRADLRDVMIIENNLRYKNILHRKEALMSNIDHMVKRDRCLAEGRPLPPPPPKKAQLTTISQGGAARISLQPIQLQ